MRKIFLFAILCGLSSIGQAQITAVCGTLYLPNGAKYNGSLQISWPIPWTGGDGRPMPAGPPIAENVQAGVLNFSLEANSTGTPSGTSYSVLYRPTATTAVTEIWVVPYQAIGCVNITAIRQNQAPPIVYTTLPYSAITGLTSTDVLFGAAGGGIGQDPAFTYAASVFGVPNVKDAGLAGSGVRCLQTDNLGNINIFTGPCGTGGGGGSISRATGSFSGQTSVTATHNLNSAFVTVSVYDTSSPPQLVEPNTIALTNLNTATITFTNPQSGTWIVEAGTGLPTFPFVNQTSVTMPHNLGVQFVIVQCYTNASPPLWIEPNTVAMNSTTTATVTFTSAQTGTCLVQ